MNTDILIQTLIAKIQEQQKTIEVLVGKISLLEAELAIYKNKKNSNNSHIPPSKDENRPKKNQSLREKSDKKPGGQPGHEGKTLECSAVWNLLRNPVYCGKILTCGYRELHKTYVPGQHDAIISETLFNEVQDFLDGKKKNYRTKVSSLEVLQLRGFIKCPKCGKLLTGSASRGHGGLYYYYHCSSSCGTRFKSQKANELFAGELKKYIPRPGMAEVFKIVINEVYLAKTKNQKDEIKNIKTELEQLNSRLSKARELLLSCDLDGTDYKEIKAESDKKIAYLEGKALDLNRGTTSIAPLLDRALNSLMRLDTLYAEADTKRKREIIGSMYPEKLTFDGTSYRTSRLNEAVELIYKLGDGFSENKKGQTSQKTDLSTLVVPRGFEPRHTESKSVVLPLYYGTKVRKSKGSIKKYQMIFENKAQ